MTDSVLPFDCKEIFDDTLSDVDQTSFEKFKNGFDKLNDVLSDVFSSIKDEIVPIGITIGAEIGLTGIAWLLKRFIRKAVTRVIFMMVTGGFDLLDAIQMVQIGTELIRGLTGTPLNIRLDKEIITNGFKGAFETWQNELNNDKTLNCYRTHYLDYLTKTYPDKNYTQEYINEFLNNLTAIYKVVKFLDALKIPEDMATCMPCLGYVKKIKDGKESYEYEPDSKPSFCKINESTDLLFGYPSTSCNQDYRNAFMNYINNPYVVTGRNINIEDYNWLEVKTEYGDKCSLNNPEYYFCLIGDKNKCKQCLTAPLKTTPPRAGLSILKTESQVPTKPSKKSNKKLFVIVTIIIIICFLLYLYFLLKKNVKSN